MNKLIPLLIIGTIMLLNSVSSVFAQDVIFLVGDEDKTTVYDTEPTDLELNNGSILSDTGFYCCIAIIFMIFLSSNLSRNKRRRR